MFTFLYDFIQFLALLALLPKLICRWIFKKDRSLLVYLGFFLPKAKPSKGLCFMFYAVSVGEVKAAASLFAKMKEVYPTATFHVSCRTKTGLEEAKRSLLNADSYFLFPFDFSWIAKLMLHRLRPDAVFIIEGDLWFNFLKAVKACGIFLCLVSGKISERSYKRFSYFPSFSKKLFGLFSLICAQNKVFAKRFACLGADPNAIIVTGNIKLGAQAEGLSKESLNALQEKLGIKEEDFVIVIGSTHAPEEEKMIEVLKKVWVSYPRVKCFIVPRHPERFLEVKQLLISAKTSSISFSSIEEKTGEERIVLIDKMGLLSDLYQLADLAIVGGSFAKHLKGHNILEPIQRGIPVVFGPFMSDQKDLVDLVLSHKAGLQVDISSLESTIELLCQDPNFLALLKESGETLHKDLKGTFLRTWLPVYEHIERIF